jgi:hypothetical protein
VARFGKDKIGHAR